MVFWGFGSSSWNIRKLFKLEARKFHFLKYKKKFQGRFFYFLSSESSLLKYKKFFFLKGFISRNTRNAFFFWENIRKFHFLKYEKNFFLRKYKKFFQGKILRARVVKCKKFFSLRARKFHFTKYKKNLFEKIQETFLE